MSALPNFLDELTWRKMIHDHMPGTRELLNERPVKGYIGFDPTADSLGVGNLVQVMTLLHFQRNGHIPYVIVGGATGMVGDPSGKSAERNLLDKDTLEHNVTCQKNQLMRFLDFSGSNAAVMLNNYDWYKDMSFLSFIRDVGKHISVNYMMAKDSVKSRLGQGMSFTEFSYQLVQGYDFYYLWKEHGVRLQMGGSDQWGNIVTGTELIRRKSGGEAFALTTPLIKKADGSKFGKSESGNIWLDEKRTSPYHFYQFWLNTADEDAENYIRVFTVRSRNEIEGLIEEHRIAPHARKLQSELAKDVTCRVHGELHYKKALEASELLFGKGTEEGLRKLTEQELLSLFDGVPRYDVPRNAFTQGISILDLLAVESGVCESKGEARKLIQQGAILLNKQKQSDPGLLVDESALLSGRYLLVQKGKKNYSLIMARS